MSDKMICTTCGYVGYSKRAIRGNILVEIILWCMFLLPGIIYNIYRSSSRQNVCPQCKNATMIPVTTPIGEKLYASHESSLTPEAKESGAKNEGKRRNIEMAVKIIVIGFVLWITISVISVLF